MRHTHTLFFSFVKRQQSDAPAADVEVRSAMLRAVKKKNESKQTCLQKKKTIARGTRLLRMSTCEACLCCAQCDAARASGAPKLGFFFFGVRSAPSMRVRRTHMYTDIVVAIVVVPGVRSRARRSVAP